MLNCTAGTIDDSNFSKPMPAIGLYIAAAALLCAVLMAVDAGKGLWRKRYWIPTKCFSVDAASLTVIGVAIKLSVDLNSAMPSKVDQLAKLSTSAFICTVLANMLPSLGRLANGELLANTIALSILIITSIVNLCIQINTGVIHAFKAAHIVMIVMMSFILHECIATAAYLPALKSYLNEKFEEKWRQDVSAVSSETNNIPISKRMEDCLMNVSMMAQSSCPQFVMARSLRSFSVAILGLMSALTFFVILIASIVHENKFMGLNTCSGDSDYKWSVLGVLIAQTIAVVMGLVAPVSRVIYFICAAIKEGLLHQPRKEEALEEGEEKQEVEWFWWLFEGTNESPIFSCVEDRQKRPHVYRIKKVCRQLLNLFKFLCKSAFTTKIINSIFSLRILLENKNSVSQYFLHVVGKEMPFKLMEEYCSCDTQRYINAGKNGKPRNLINFPERHLSRDIRRSDMPDDYRTSLSVLTSVSIVTALPSISPTRKEMVMKSVNEALVYIKLVEDGVKCQLNYMYGRAAANIIWQGLDRDRSWFDVNLQKLALESTRPSEVLQRLEQQYTERESFEWMKKHKRSKFDRVIYLKGAATMQQVCQVMLQQFGNEDSEVVFELFCTAIARVLGDCFAYLMRRINSICIECPIEKRRETIFRMLKVFGETKEIMEILEQRGIKIEHVTFD